MSGGGGGFFKTTSQGFKNSVDNWREDPFGEMTKALTSFATLGIAQYNPTTGKADEGTSLHGIDETIGAISGANVARKTQGDTQDQIDVAQQAFAKQQSDMQLQNFRADVVASRSAQALRDTAAARSGGGTNFRPGIAPPVFVNKLGAEQNTLLGV